MEIGFKVRACKICNLQIIFLSFQQMEVNLLVLVNLDFRLPRYLNCNYQCCTGQYVETYCSTLLLTVI